MGMLEKLLLAGAFVAGLIAGLGLFSLYDGLIDDPAVSRVAREAGAQAERGLWQKEKRDAEAAAERRLAERQAQISAVDMAVEVYRNNDRLRAAAFEAAMKEQRNEDDKGSLDRSACALPDRVWKEL